MLRRVSVTPPFLYSIPERLAITKWCKCQNYYNKIIKSKVREGSLEVFWLLLSGIGGVRINREKSSKWSSENNGRRMRETGARIAKGQYNAIAWKKGQETLLPWHAMEKGWKPGNMRFSWVAKAPRENEDRKTPTDCSQYAPIYISGCLCAACVYGQPHFLCSTTLAANVTLEGILTVRSATGL